VATQILQHQPPAVNRTTRIRAILVADRERLKAHLSGLHYLLRVLPEGVARDQVRTLILSLESSQITRTHQIRSTERLAVLQTPAPVVNLQTSAPRRAGARRTRRPRRAAPPSDGEPSSHSSYAEAA